MTKRRHVVWTLGLVAGLAVTAMAQAPRPPAAPAEPPPVEPDDSIVAPVKPPSAEHDPFTPGAPPRVQGRPSGTPGFVPPSDYPQPGQFGPPGGYPGAQTGRGMPGMFSKPGMPGGMGGMIGGMPGGLSDDPEMRALQEQDQEFERETAQLAEHYRRTHDEAERESLRQQIAEVVEQHFEVRQERRELEIARMEDELNRLRAGMKKRGDDRQAVINRRIAQLTGEDDLSF